MISKAHIKEVRLLHQKKFREENGLFIAEGPKVVNELLNSKYKLKEVFCTDEFRIQNIEFRINKITEKELGQISALTTPNQVLGVFEIPSPLVSRPSSFSLELLIALDDIRDPGNLGTIIRIADWFGIHHIICSENCVDIYNPKVVQASMGSIARVNVFYENLASFFNDSRIMNKELKIYAATLDGKNIYTEQLPDKGIILIGNESKGISGNVLQFVTHKVSIPNFSPKTDSLNAAVATAIICSEFRRNNKLNSITS